VKKTKKDKERTQRLSLSSLQQDVLRSVMFVVLVGSRQVTQRFESNLLRSSGANTATATSLFCLNAHVTSVTHRTSNVNVHWFQHAVVASRTYSSVAVVQFGDVIT